MNIKCLSKDILKCTKYSCLLSSILILISAIVGAIISKADWIGTLECIKGTLFIVGSIGLFIGAIAIFLKGRPNELTKQHASLENNEANSHFIEEDLDENMEEWRSKFTYLSFKWAIIILSFIVLGYGCIVDKVLFIILTP